MGILSLSLRSTRQYKPIPVAARSKAWVCGRSRAGIEGLESHRGHGRLSLGSVVCCQIWVSATGETLVQRSPTDCVVSERDLETSKVRGLGPLGLYCFKYMH